MPLSAFDLLTRTFSLPFASLPCVNPSHDLTLRFNAAPSKTHSSLPRSLILGVLTMPCHKSKAWKTMFSVIQNANEE